MGPRAAPRAAPPVLNGPWPVVAVVAAAAVVGGLHGGFTDLFVYEHAGRAVLDGLPAIPPRDPVTGLAFTYPPFAALVMVPLALVPGWLAAALWTGLSVGALAAVVVVVGRALDRPTPGWLVAGLTVGALALEPVWQSLAFGQVNVLLMLAVLVDVLAPPQRRWSGLLLGLAAGIKLTPLVFVVLLLLVGRRAVAGCAIVTFAATVALGFAVRPRWSQAYWVENLLDAGRVGPPALAHNQSLYGSLTRLLDTRPPVALWLAVAVPVGLAILLVGAAWWRRGDRMLGVCLGAMAMLLVSPIAWSHHWVWCVPVALVLWERSRVAAGVWAAVFVARPVLWPPWGQGREYGWGPAEHVVGNAYVLAALALAVWAALALRRGSVPGPADHRAPAGPAHRQGPARRQISSRPSASRALRGTRPQT